MVSDIGVISLLWLLTAEHRRHTTTYYGTSITHALLKKNEFIILWVDRNKDLAGCWVRTKRSYRSEMAFLLLEPVD